jgi:hypothetical protein
MGSTSMWHEMLFKKTIWIWQPLWTNNRGYLLKWNVANKEQCYKSDKWCIEVENIQMLKLDQMYTL